MSQVFDPGLKFESLNPCWIVGSVILLLNFEKGKLPSAGEEGSLLKKSVNEFPWSAVAKGSKLVLRIVPIRSANKGLLKKSYGLE